MKDQITYMANLSRIKITDAEASKIAKDADELLKTFSSVKATGQEKTHIINAQSPIREDFVGKCDASGIAENFQSTRNGYVRVPKGLQ
jgi:aspartyl/glutamyl-tRNA(Asn/Gln) amidotransferase C subunit